ncbi:hypothetical protein DPX16_19980 [Anabarilius grahami]|uniref:Uncharacterized protein n=1 Tax=Anabarilius grahami TaxID=495550 RepID=A0A3N0XPA8_ANAGA|nr:hypothetical protein DPX16_19980 [Anabarilius grahami]
MFRTIWQCEEAGVPGHLVSGHTPLPPSTLALHYRPLPFNPIQCSSYLAAISLRPCQQMALQQSGKMAQSQQALTSEADTDSEVYMMGEDKQEDECRLIDLAHKGSAE